MSNLHDNKNKNWKEIISLSQKILTMAHEYDWESLAELEQQRKQMICDYFVQYQQACGIDFVEKLKELIEINEKLIHIAKQSRHGVREHLRSLYNEKQLKIAYDCNDGES